MNPSFRPCLVLVAVALSTTPALADSRAARTIVRTAEGERLEVEHTGEVRVTGPAHDDVLAGRLTADERAALGAALTNFDVDRVAGAIARSIESPRVIEATYRLELPGGARTLALTGVDLFAFAPRKLDAAMRRISTRLRAEHGPRRSLAGRLSPAAGQVLVLEAGSERVALAPGVVADRLRALGAGAWTDVTLDGRVATRADGQAELVLRGVVSRGARITGVAGRGALRLPCGAEVALGRALPAALVGREVALEGTLTVGQGGEASLAAWDVRSPAPEALTGELVRGADGNALLRTASATVALEGDLAALLLARRAGSRVTVRVWPGTSSSARLVASLDAVLLRPAHAGAAWSEGPTLPAGARVVVLGANGSSASVIADGRAFDVPTSLLELDVARPGLTGRLQ